MRATASLPAICSPWIGAASTPVVYALKPDGSLAGLWDAGKGEETLTPEE